MANSTFESEIGLSPQRDFGTGARDYPGAKRFVDLGIKRILAPFGPDCIQAPGS
jgi:hypothetical protein